MYRTLNATLQLLAFGIATLLATGALVLGGLNESQAASDTVSAAAPLLGPIR